MFELNIDQLQKKMERGELTARKIVEYFLERIETIDKDGPNVNAIIEVNPDAIAIADKLDKEREENKIKGPLHGIPVIIKDNIDTADKMMTTAGSLALEGHIASQDSFIVKKLRAAGAIILAKANLSEWANFRSSRSSSGWSSRGGQTLNPYVLSRSPCGSSSGSAVAVAADLCTVAIGTETDGSIICPAQTNSIVGIKPTIGLVSRSGIIPISHTQDTAGPMGRTVKDTVLLLNAIVGADSNDKTTTEHNFEIPVDYSEFLDINGLKGARIGVARNYFGRNENIDMLMEQAIEKMKELGAELIDPIEITTLKDLRDPEFQVLLYDFKNDLNEYLASTGPNNKNRTLKDIIEFNRKSEEKVMPYFKQEVLLLSEEKGSLTSKEYVEALNKCDKFARKELDKILKENKLDAIVAPSGGMAWFIDWVNGDSSSGGSSSAAAVAGYPNITVPLGYVWGLPVGISFFAGAFQEPTLIKIAYAYEQATKVRIPPKFLKSIDFST